MTQSYFWLFKILFSLLFHALSLLKSFWSLVFLLSTFTSRKFNYLLPFLCYLSIFFLTPTLKSIDLVLKSDFSKLVSTYESEQMTLVFVTHKFPVPSSFLLFVQMYVYAFMVYTRTQTLTHIYSHVCACTCTHSYTHIHIYAIHVLLFVDIWIED